MKKKILLLALSLSVIFANAQRRPGASPYLTQSFNAGAVHTINVETSGGSITVEGGKGKGTVEMYVWPSNSDRRKQLSPTEIKAILEQYYDIDVRVEGNRLIAKAKRKNNRWSDRTALSVSFVVYSGTAVNSELYTSGGSIALANVTGDQLFRTSGGSLKIDHAGGKIKGSTSGGGIELSNSRDNIDLSTSGGSIQADHVSGTIRLSTSGGSLALSDLTGDVNAHTSGGSITASDINGTFITGTSGGSVTLKGISGNLEAHTSGGRIAAAMVRTKDYVKLSTSAGSIDLRLPRTPDVQLNLRGSRVMVSPLNNFNGSIDKNRVSGTLGNGRLQVAATASSGTVEVSL